MNRKDRQRDRCIVSKESPGFSDFKRRGPLILPGLRRHFVSCEADRIEFSKPEPQQNSYTPDPKEPHDL